MSDTNPDDLDPDDWDSFRQLAHTALDTAIDYVATIRDRPVWQQAPEDASATFARPVPRHGGDLAALIADISRDVIPYANGNVHPRFMGWVHGAATPVGIVAEVLTAALDMNCGGRNHIAHAVENQITRWMAELFGYPDDASGLFVTGTSMANFLAVIVAKVERLGRDSRRRGLLTAPRLTAYTSTEAHACIAQAMELSGLGSDQLRSIPVDPAGRMKPADLEAAMLADIAAGHEPFLIAATVGTVNTGSIDPLPAIATIAARHGLWFHIDGAFGAMAALSPTLRPLLTGIERSDSIAFDFHKWGHVPYDAGFFIVRDADAHRTAFAQAAAYLQRAEAGLAAGATWPCDLGPDLSRGNRALKTWLTLSALGTDRIGRAIEANCAAARHLAARLAGHRLFALKAPVALNIVCFGLRQPTDPTLNRRLVIDAHLSGTAAPSWTTLDGEEVIRCAIVNHRTTLADVDTVLDALTAAAEAHGAGSQAALASLA